MLSRGTRRHDKPLITPGPIAATAGGNFAWALALARPGSLQLACLGTPLSIAVTLRTPLLSALGTVAVNAAGAATPPASGLVPTGVTAIACLRPTRLKPLFTALEQTATRTGGLRLMFRGGILEWAQGRCLLPEGQVPAPGDRSAPGRFVRTRGNPVYERKDEGNKTWSARATDRNPPLPAWPSGDRNFGPMRGRN